MLVPGHFGAGDGEARYGGGGCHDEAAGAMAEVNKSDFKGMALGSLQPAGGEADSMDGHAAELSLKTLSLPTFQPVLPLSLLSVALVFLLIIRVLLFIVPLSSCLSVCLFVCLTFLEMSIFKCLNVSNSKAPVLFKSFAMKLKI